MWVDPHGLCAKEEGANLATNGFGGVPAHLLPKNFDKSMVRPSPEIDPMSQAIKPVNIFPIEWAVQEVADIVGALEDIYSNGITASSAMVVVVAAIPGKVADEVLEPITKKLDNVDVLNSADDVARASSKPEWLRRLNAGIDFNKAQSPNYPYNEVYINKPSGGKGYYRLDSYNPEAGEIISRKFTQFSEIQDQTAINYINEIQKKYPVGAMIADVPSSGSLAGQQLQGRLILEVPVQNNPISQITIDAADNAGVLIRDIDGRIY